MGVTYSRSIPGTGVPFKERFQTRPGGACLRAPSLKSKCQFWDGQQPKLREMILVKFFLVVYFLTDAARLAQPLRAVSNLFAGVRRLPLVNNVRNDSPECLKPA